MWKYLKRRSLRRQMRETAEMIEVCEAQLKALPDQIAALEQHAKKLREADFWLDRSPSAQACVGRA